ncbi:unnamed protein product, partial [Didymodactylos carnosus]
DGDKMAPTMEKKISELEMGLLHLQQNIEIPEVNLIIHPIVAQVVQKCAEEQRRPKVDDFNDFLTQTEFLNSLQSHVNRWVREIQKVTKLSIPMRSYISLTILISFIKSTKKLLLLLTFVVLNLVIQLPLVFQLCSPDILNFLIFLNVEILLLMLDEFYPIHWRIINH